MQRIHNVIECDVSGVLGLEARGSRDGAHIRKPRGEDRTLGGCIDPSVGQHILRVTIRSRRMQQKIEVKAVGTSRHARSIHVF
jgi:hypothetical protein